MNLKPRQAAGSGDIVYLKYHEISILKISVAQLTVLNIGRMP